MTLSIAWKTPNKPLLNTHPRVSMKQEVSGILSSPSKTILVTHIIHPGEVTQTLGLVSNLMASQDARLSKLEADFKQQQKSWTLLEDLTLYDNESWNDLRDFAKPVKAIALPQDIPRNPARLKATVYPANGTDRIVLGNPARLKATIMRRKLDPEENANRGVCNFTRKINGMHVFIGNFTYVVYFMIIEDVSSIIDPRLSQVVLGKPFVEISNITHDPPEGVVWFTNGDNEVVYKMPHKINNTNHCRTLKKNIQNQSALETRRTRVEEWGTLPSDTVKNPKLSTYLVLFAHTYPTKDPQCSTQTHSSINAITIHTKQQSTSYDDGEKENKEEEDNLENTHVNPPTPPDPSTTFIIEKVLKFTPFLESLRLVPPSSNTKLICTKEEDGDVMFIKIIPKDDNFHKEEPKVGE
nr:protein kinase-like domain, concanavalin A-like lectin/glucanase domain protein [Tanacetum cinerariifolium]